jgi:ABC-type glycerol-3-phosphate transport system permease component
MSHKLSLSNIGGVSFLVIIAIFTYYPFLFLLFTSFKDLSQFYHHFWTPTLPLRWENYYNAWLAIRHYIFNSLIVTSTSVVGVCTVASMSAFAFARYKFPFRELLFYMLLILIMIPGTLTLVPSFILVRDLGLLNTRWALILPYISGGQIFAIFILRTFFSSLPEELFEAARIDGATIWQSYSLIALPLSRAILGVVAIMNVLNTWNDYIWPSVVISEDSLRTLTVGLAYFQGQYQTQYGPQMAGYVIASIPLLILFFTTMKEFIAGLTSGALKM